MKKRNWLIFGFLAIFILIGWFVYQKVTDDTYEGMSIIPEHYEDIPLFEGLKPTRNDYVIEGDYWVEIDHFYEKELPKHGWKLEHKESALNDDDDANDWGGSYSRWRKEGFDGELSISAHYNQFDKQTEVMFDKTPIHHLTTWIDNVPNSICIFKSVEDKQCTEIKDQSKIQKLVHLINTAIDWKEEVKPRANSSVIERENLQINVFYEDGKEIYFQSEKGTKLMKPESEFFKLTNL